MEYLLSADALSSGLCPFPSGTVGTVFGRSASWSDGFGKVEYSILSGSLPPGIVLTKDGLFAGFPEVSGTFSFTLGAADSRYPKATTSASCTINVAPVVLNENGTCGGRSAQQWLDILQSPSATWPTGSLPMVLGSRTYGREGVLSVLWGNDRNTAAMRELAAAKLNVIALGTLTDIFSTYSESSLPFFNNLATMDAIQGSKPLWDAVAATDSQMIDKRDYLRNVINYGNWASPWYECGY